jgi:hypothetical protein
MVASHVRYPYLFIVIHITSTAKGRWRLVGGDVAFLAAGVTTAFSSSSRRTVHELPRLSRPGHRCRVGCGTRQTRKQHIFYPTCRPSSRHGEHNRRSHLPSLLCRRHGNSFASYELWLVRSLRPVSQVADVVKALERSPPVVIPCGASISDAWKASNPQTKTTKRQRTKATVAIHPFILLLVRRFLRTPRCCRRRSRRRAEATTA